MKTVGIDLGHCHVTATLAFCSKDNRYRIVRLEFADRETILNTQLVLTKEQMQQLQGNSHPSFEDLCDLGDIGIGNSLNEPADGELFTYFKVPPKRFSDSCGNSETARQCNITHGQVMACFAFALVQALLKVNADYLNDNLEDLSLLIGCPSTDDWMSEENRQSYADLIQKATGVHSVTIVPESRGAMFSSIENGHNQLSAVKGAVVFDFGSSTADCTYMLLGQKCMEYSWTLGASAIELEMLRELNIAAQDECQTGEYVFPAYEATLITDLRRMKEDYYKLGRGSSRPLVAEYVRFKGDPNPVFPRLIVNVTFMDKVTKESIFSVLCNSNETRTGSWYALCRQFFQEASQRIQGAGYALDTIILTGGASQMSFIHEACNEVFPNVRIFSDTNPSYTVSNGLGWVSVSDENAELARQKARNVVFNQCGISLLQHQLEDVFFHDIREKTITVANEWAQDSAPTLTARDLQTRLDAALSAEAFKEQLKQNCNTCIDQWLNRLASTITEAINTQSSKIYTETLATNIQLPPNILQTLRENLHFDLPDLDKLVKPLFSDTTIQALLKSLLYFLLADRLPFLGLFLLFRDLDDEARMNKQLRQSNRQKLAKNIPSQLDSQKDKILSPIRDCIKDYEKTYPKQLDKALTTAFEIATLKRFDA